MPGYSAIPLSKKLGLKPPMELLVVNTPDEYPAWLGELTPGITLVSEAPDVVHAAHVFVSQRRTLEEVLIQLRRQLLPTGFVWVSWPKKASKVPTEVTEDIIREVALPLEFVDVKVCAVSDVWSGLKLVIRKEARGAT